MRLGLGLGIARTRKIGGLRPATSAFVAATGATDRANLDKWVRGLESLGVWNNIVCWPMLASQNYGTGTKIKALGGLGTFADGDLVNGPAWGASGITFNGSSQYVTVPNPAQSTALPAYSIWSVFDSDQTINRAVFGSYNVGGGTIGPSLLAGGSPGQGSAAANIYHDLTSDGNVGIGTINNSGRRIVNGNTGSMQTAFAGFSGIELGMSANGSTRETQSVASTTAWNNNTAWRMGSRLNGSYYFKDIQAMNLFANIYLTPTQAIAIRDLYKSTLGQTIGLP